jgi:hypothetical protein
MRLKSMVSENSKNSHRVRLKLKLHAAEAGGIQAKSFASGSLVFGFWSLVRFKSWLGTVAHNAKWDSSWANQRDSLSTQSTIRRGP